MFDLLLEEIQQKNIEGNLHFEIPFSQQLFNYIFEQVADGSEIIETLEVIDINYYDFSINLSLLPVKIRFRQFELIDRNIKGQIINHFNYPDFTLKFKILEGLNYVERKVIDFALDRFVEDDAITLEDEILSVNLSKLTPIAQYAHMTKWIKNTDLQTKQDKVLFKFDAQF